MDRPSGAGERRDKLLDDAEAKALGPPPPSAPPPTAPSSTPKPEPKPGLLDRVKKVFNIAESSHNPENRSGVSHGDDERGFT